MSALWTGKPVRLQLRRTKGFNLQVASVQKNGRQAVNCARPGPYGNRYAVTAERSPMEACALFHADIKKHGGIFHWKTGKLMLISELKAKLRGKNQACFCSLDAKWCHVDSLIKVANGD